MVKNLDLPQASMILDRVTISDTAATIPPTSCVSIDSLGNLTIFRDTFLYCKGSSSYTNTGATAAESGTTVTLTAGSPSTWGAAFRLNASIHVTGCSVTAYNSTWQVTNSAAGTASLTYTSAQTGLGAATGCTVNPVTYGWLVQSTSGFTGPLGVNNVWVLDMDTENSENCKI
jgi:hypothetical protein